MTLPPDALVDAPLAPAASSAPKIVLTPAEKVAVTIAAQTAATEQGSQAPLFANLASVASSPALPPKLLQAVQQVLAQQTDLDPNLSGADIKTAFQKSGLFLEASLATGKVASSSSPPDLKAALVVLRQTLQQVLGPGGPTGRARYRRPSRARYRAPRRRRIRRPPQRKTSSRRRSCCRSRACRLPRTLPKPSAPAGPFSWPRRRASRRRPPRSTCCRKPSPPGQPRPRPRRRCMRPSARR